VVDTVAANFNKLIYSRIDMFASNSRNSMAVIKQMNIGHRVKVIPPPITINNGYFGFSKKRKLHDFLIKFDEQLKNMIDSGELQRLNRQYQLDYLPKG
jgi:polar amino acid transport system substrate-binding protein